MKFADRLKFTATGTSAATITVGAAAAACRTLAQAIADGALTVGDAGVPFTTTDGTAWEDSLFTVTSGTVLTRTSVLASSAGGTTAATFSGPLTVFNAVPGSILSRIPVDSDAPFSQSVPLTQAGTAWMPQQTVSGALNFAPAANAVKGAYAYVRLVADGANAPTWTGFTEEIGSAGYDNRNGIINRLQFSYDGYDYWVAASQALNAVAVDVTPPTASSAMVSNAAPNVVNITMSENLDSAYVPAASAFTVSGHTVSSVAVSGAVVSLTVSAAFANGEAARTIAYVQPASGGARDVAGNLLASFSGLSVTNNVNPADTTPPTFSSAQVTNSQPTIVQVTMSEPLAAVVPAASAFTVSGGKTVSSVSIASNVISLTCSAAYSNGDTITVQYTKPGSGNMLQDAAGNATASFGPSSVTNNVAAAPGATKARMNAVALVNLTEGGTAPDYTYTGTNGAYNGTAMGGTSNLSMAGDFTITGQILTLGSAKPMFGLHAGTALIAYPSIPYNLFANTTGYQYLGNGAYTKTDVTTGVIPAAGDWWRWRRVGTTYYAEVSQDSQQTWKTIFTLAGAAGTLYAQLQTDGTAVLSTLSGTGLA